MTFQRFLAEWADHNAQLVDNRPELTVEQSGPVTPHSFVNGSSSPAKRSNADDFKGD